ncbi:MAG: helix-turn-helix transcriptional regulator [Crocinitomicaceae bacterium]|nr:helix-turn-helix transcriptional regulator [Crocinitomicaceae bacterium]
MNIGVTIKKLRKEKGLNQQEFGKLTGITQTSLSLIENGNTIPNKSTLKSICKVLNVPEELLYFLSIDESDVPAEKREKFDLLYPTARDLMLKIFSE